MREVTATISVRTDAQVQRVQALFQLHKRDFVIKSVEAYPLDEDEFDEKDAVAIIFTFASLDEFHYKLDAAGEIMTAGFFGGGADSWFA